MSGIKDIKNSIKIVIQFLACVGIFIGVYGEYRDYIDSIEEGGFYYPSLFNTSYCVLILIGNIIWFIYLKNRKEKVHLVSHVIIALAMAMHFIDLAGQCIAELNVMYAFVLGGPSLLAFVTEIVLIISKYKETKYKKVLLMWNALIKIMSGVCGAIAYGGSLEGMIYALFIMGVSMTFVVIMWEEM